MKSSRVLAAFAAASVLMALAGCAPEAPTDPGSVVAPIIVNVGDLQGATVEVPITTVLVIDTGDLDVDSYTAEVEDPSVAEFVQGKDDGSATFNPGLTPLAVGKTSVTLANEQGGIQEVTFVLEVTE